MPDQPNKLLDRLISGPPVLPTRGPLRILSRYELVARAFAVPFRVWFEDLQASKIFWPVLLPALVLYAAHRWRIERRELVQLAQQIVASEAEKGDGT